MLLWAFYSYNFDYSRFQATIGSDASFFQPALEGHLPAAICSFGQKGIYRQQRCEWHGLASPERRLGAILRVTIRPENRYRSTVDQVCPASSQLSDAPPSRSGFQGRADRGYFDDSATTRKLQSGSVSPYMVRCDGITLICASWLSCCSSRQRSVPAEDRRPRSRRSSSPSCVRRRLQTPEARRRS